MLNIGKLYNRFAGGILLLSMLFTGMDANAQVVTPEAEVTATPAETMEVFSAAPGVTGDRSAFLVLDLNSGEILASHNPAEPLVPASIMKCVTTATLLPQLGEDFTYETKVYLTGSVRDGVLEGNILVEGSGDPSLNSRHVVNNPDICSEIVSKLRTEGVRKVQGKIVVDEEVWSGPAVPSSWASGDLPHAYGTGSHGLNFEDNATGNRSVANPAGVFSTRLHTALNRAGISVDGETLHEGDRQLLLVHHSVPLDEIMRSCMMRSDNQYAEALLRTFEVAHKRKGNTANAASHEMDYWKKNHAPMAGVNIVDGSGLSRQNRVTANFMAHVLADRAKNPYYASFFPLAGQEGTLKNFLAATPLEGYVAMKTGSMNGIQCYAGYKLDDDYVPTHVIVVIMNELRDRTRAREAVKTALLKIFGEK
ncbi:MAG: D-alanyl-D-alanine carboxypeptidase/D-alanyl-D-alanine-endopeptidase [Bacteroides sp.]|nr:D-alanyl-D-alanine carboxypeptidase/D-alanyl-D-alanine-endopeptidase [Bacteroides sp.]